MLLSMLVSLSPVEVGIGILAGLILLLWGVLIGVWL